MLKNIFSLHGKRALVTGSSRGIGHAVAMLMAEAGAHVVFHGIEMSEKLELSVKTAAAKGLSCEAVAADVSSEEGIRRLAAAAGGIDILVLNASVQTYMTVEDFNYDEFDREFHANVRASIELVRAFLPGMRERGFGRIISLGSVNQYRPAARLAVYAATKAAQNNVIMGVARIYAKYGITANNIAPGVIATDRNREVLSNETAAAQIMGLIPAARFGTAEDCAALALLLASEAGSYINGADIPVDGGMHL
ncbi:MAG: SDR family NAD(P)-dependent oxidoreductase [Victivallaceae bacterium]|nr:SDR family oxidoreductase [Victivallaceae bacterium]